MKSFKYNLLIFFIACSCSSGNKNLSPAGHSVYLQNHDNIKPIENGADFFSEINLIPLKEEDDFLIGNVDKMIKRDSFFYLLDKKTKSIYKYDQAGNPVKRFLRIGGSGDEYFDIIDFDISDKEVAIFCVPPKALYTDLDFNIKKNKSLEGNYFDRIVSWGDKIFLYNHRNRVVAYINQETEIPTECLHTKNLKGDLIDDSPAFFKTSNALYFQSPGDDCIYKLEGDNFLPYLSLDFDHKNETMEFYMNKNAPEITFGERLSHPIPYIKGIFEKNDEITIIYVYNLLYRICAYNKLQRKYKDEIVVSFSVFSSHFSDDALYGLSLLSGIDVFETPSFKELMKGVKYNFDGKLEFDDEYGNPIIVEQILK
jgi:hypothetical protein